MGTRHFCAEDWHVILIAWIDGGDASFGHQQAEASLKPVTNNFTLDGAALATARTPVKPALNPQGFGLVLQPHFAGVACRLRVPEARRGMETALKQVHDWAAELEALGERLAPRFGRVEVRRRASGFLQGLLSGTERKNGWQLAEQVGDSTPDGMQRLLNHARWDADAVRDDLRDYVVEHLGDPDGVLVIDETGFLKKGTKSAGVQRQYSGTAGRIENCQIGVFMGYASRRGHALIDRELYLPASWTQDRPRCREAGIGDQVGFHTKPQLARRMLARALEAEVPVAWVTADEVYGGDGRLRRWLEERDAAHVLAVNCNQSLVSGLFRFERADQLAARIPPGAWRHLSAGQGAKGERIYAWARVTIRPLREPGRGHWLLVRRSLADGELAYYVCYGPAETSLAELVRVAGVRWTVECGFQQGKGQTGLDHYQVRRYQAWYRHVTLSMVAQAFLAVQRARVAVHTGGD
jgi:SRSO17 transposase